MIIVIYIIASRQNILDFVVSFETSDISLNLSENQ